MSLSLFPTQQAIKAYLTDNINWKVVSGNVPDAYSLLYDNGVLNPYLVLRFSDRMPQAGDTSFGGSQHDGYYSYVDGLCIGATDDEARELADLVNRYMIGKKFPDTGEINVQPGGGVFAISLDQQHPLAYIAVVSFTFTINNSNVGGDSLVVQ